MNTGTPSHHFGSAASSSRRTLLKTTAWSVPVVSIAAAAPAFAASPRVRFWIDDFGGERLLLSPRRMLINDITIQNLGDVDLAAGQLFISFRVPPEWGNATAWNAVSALQSLPLAAWDVSIAGNTVTFTSRAGLNPLPAGSELDPLGAARNWAWDLDLSSGGTIGDKTIVITVGALNQPGVRTQTFALTFGGNAWSRLLNVVEIGA